jgi:hypothetical protein
MAQLDATKKLMSALVRVKPKPHEEMKVGKKTKKANRRRRKNETAYSRLDRNGLRNYLQGFPVAVSCTRFG